MINSISTHVLNTLKGRYFFPLLPIILVCLGWFQSFEACAAPPAGYYLVWADEFNGSSIDPTKWNIWIGANRDAINTNTAVTVTGGNVKVTTFTTNSTHYTGIIFTENLLRIKYGYLEGRQQNVGSPGMWSAFWLQTPTSGLYFGDPATSGTEIDILEQRVSDSAGVNINDKIQSTIHWDGYGPNHYYATSGLIGSGLSTGFHTYGMLWTTSRYDISVDGITLWTNSSAMSARSEVIFLSSEVWSNSWAGVVPAAGYGNLTTSTTIMSVDYVRYYAPTTTVFWSGSTSGDWTASTNWIAGMVPQSGNDVQFSYLGTGNFSTTLGQNFVLGSLSLMETPPVTISGGTLTLNAGGLDMISALNDATINSPVVLNAAQTWKIASGRGLTVNGNMSGNGGFTKSGGGTMGLFGGQNTYLGATIVNDGAFVLNGTLNGALTINPCGRWGPGFSYTVSTITTNTIGGTLTLNPGGTTAVDVNKTLGVSDLIQCNSNVIYGGTLEVQILGGAYAAGDSFKLFNAASYSGSFTALSPVTPGTGLAWSTSTMNTDGTLRVVTSTNTPPPAGFVTGDLAVLRVGDGVSIASSGAPGVIIDYPTWCGPSPYQVSIPSTGTTSLLFGASAYTGSLSLSANKNSLIFAGYNVPAGSYTLGSIDSSTSADVPRAVGSMSSTGSFIRQATTTLFSGTTIRAGAGNGTGNFWAVGGSGGIAYLGTNSTATLISSTPAACRNMNFINNNLYFTESGTPRGIMKFTGGPTVATTPTSVVDNSTTGVGSSSPKGFAINTNLTIAYIADNRSPVNGGGIQRFNWNGSAWVYAYTLTYTLTVSQSVWEMAVDFTGTNPVIYAISGESSENHLVKITDSGTGSVYSVLQNAPAGTVFRGLSFAPTTPPAPPAAPTGLTATAVSSSQINLSWTASSGATSYNVKRATVNGGPYTTITNGVTGTSFSDTALAASTTYYYVVSAVNSGGESANSTQASATTQPATITYVHVKSITMSWVKSGSKYKASAVVNVVNASGVAVNAATVTGDFTGSISNLGLTGVTTSTGDATITSTTAISTGTVTFTVTNITGTNLSYDPAANVVTAASITR